MLSSSEIRTRFLKFFESRGHAILSSASLVPENDPSVLFNTAGMQPLVPYLMGQKHPLSNRLASCQKCVRTGDIDEVGNNKNLTFFEMLGNWSLGDYFKEDAIKWSFEFLTSPDEGLGLDPARLYVTVFEGDDDAPRDLEAVEIWKKYIPEHRIYFLPKKNNWWSPGDNGPCGPDTEMFYDVTPEGLGDLTHDEYVAADDDGRVVEIWNDVFMEYKKENGQVVGKLSQKNVDTGSGLERLAMIVQKVSNVYETDMFAPAMHMIKKMSISWVSNIMVRRGRIVADHVRSSVFLIGDGVTPSNKDQGYVLRRLLRRAVMQGYALKLASGTIAELASYFTVYYQNAYPELFQQRERIIAIIDDEQEKFKKTLEQGLKEFEKGTDPFILATTYGFPIELTQELAAEKTNYTLNILKFNEDMRAHQEKSRFGAEQKFKGGLANTNEQTVKLHTAHHLLLAALQEIVSKDIHQKGSNITDERLRMDFSFDRKLTVEEVQKVENLVNSWIDAKLPVVRREMPRDEAEKLGAEMEFGAKYPDMVSVYTIQNTNDEYVSKEFCGGPHVTNTGEIGKFKIQKEEASSAGVRRIKATITE